MPAGAPITWKRRLFVVAAVAFFLVPAAFGFGNKFRELLLLLDDPEGAFTVMPITNYLLASIGFFFLFFWALMNGMFHNIEQPKDEMLATENKLDAMEMEDEDNYAGVL